MKIKVLFRYCTNMKLGRRKSENRRLSLVKRNIHFECCGHWWIKHKTIEGMMRLFFNSFKFVSNEYQSTFSRI